MLVLRERLTGLDRQSLAHTRRNAGFYFLLQGRFIFLEIFHQGAQRSRRIAASKQDRQGAHLVSVRTKRFHLEAKTMQNLQLPLQQASLRRRQRHTDRLQQNLRGKALPGALEHQLLEQDPLVGGVLVNEIQAVWPFSHQVSLTNLPDEAQQGQLHQALLPLY